MKILFFGHGDCVPVPEELYDHLLTFEWYRTGWGMVRGFKEGKFTWLHEEIK